ncbi:RNA-binding protein Musashi homolog 1-like isoform X2 [Artemia franciscana]|uniref:RNA-binding protein Musashi homolog 1-like isoform X2 n=1 Tax=Artemia franciscana TaxID=6661 RepID=UPI0032DAEF1C
MKPEFKVREMEMNFLLQNNNIPTYKLQHVVKQEECQELSIYNDSGDSGRSSPNDPPPNKLFVGGLSWHTTGEKLKEYFSQFGTVLDVLVMKDPLTQRSRGFAFITFQEASTVDKVLAIPSHTVDGKKIDPKHATPKNKGKLAAAVAAAATGRTRKIFVGGVSQDTTNEEVKAYFSLFGKVQEAVMLMDQQTKRHRGFGFVTFDDENVVDRICDIHYHTIKNKKVECKKAQPKEAAAAIQSQVLAAKRQAALTNLALLNPAASLGLINPQLAIAQAQAQLAAAQSAAATKLLSSYAPLTSYRYSPYPLPALAGAQNVPPQLGQNFQLAPIGATPQVTAAPTLPSVSLANVDMSSFQAIDWSNIYGGFSGIYGN